MNKSTMASDLADDSSLASEIVVAMNKVVGFHYRLCEVGSEGNKGECFEESKDKGLLLYHELYCDQYLNFFYMDF